MAVSIWLRNTLLNQIVLIAALMFFLALPHFRSPHHCGLAQMLSDHGGWTAAAILLCFLMASVVIFWQARPLSRRVC